MVAASSTPTTPDVSDFIKSIREKAAAARKTTKFEDRDKEGFLVVSDKTKLVGRGFVIMKTEYGVNLDNQRDQVTVQAVLDKGDQLITFNDTSKGIYKQLSSYNGEFPVHVPNGLRKSEYQVNGADAVTFYLDYDI